MSVVSENVRRLRGRMKQEDIAGEMARRGWDWKRTTVSDIETERRRLTIEEGVDLAQFFEITMDELAGAAPLPERASSVAVLSEFLARLERAVLAARAAILDEASR